MVKFNLVQNDESANITVVHDGEMFVADNTHPNFDAIVQGAVAGDTGVVDLFDIARAIVKRFEKVSERVSVANGRVYFDGVEQHNTLTEQIVRFMESDEEDYLPLVLFMEKVMNNPEEHSRENLFRWLDAEDFTITDQGDIVGYKAVRNDNGVYRSLHRGNEDVVVDGQVVRGEIPNPVGATIEMPRNIVNHDPSQGCSVGLHVGTAQFARGFGGGDSIVLRVLVNPRDVVSVPTDAGDQKMRVCRYYVDGVHEEAIARPLYEVTHSPFGNPYQDDPDEDHWDEDICEDCGEPCEDCPCEIPFF
jgi:hypothetical protein